MGKCLSTKFPADYGELTPGNTEKMTANDKKRPLIKAESDTTKTMKTKSNEMNGSYRKLSAESERDTDHEHDAINLEYSSHIAIDDNIIIEDFVKIYDDNLHEYHHYGLLLNQKQCKLYLINPHYYIIWKEFEKLSKINSIMTSDRHKNKTECNNLIFGQKDAEEMMNNLCGKKLGESNFGAAINLLMRKNKYQIEKHILLNKEWDIHLSNILKVESHLFETKKYVNHIVITNYKEKHIHFIISFFRSFGLIIKYRAIDTDSNNALHIIFINDIMLKDIQSLNFKLEKYLLNETKDKISNNIRISTYYDQINHNDDHKENVKLIDLELTYISVESFSQFINHEFDGYLYGFKLKTKGNGNDLLCLLDNNNKRFEWIAHLQYILKNNEFIKRKYSSKLRNKRSLMINLDKDLFGKTNECNKKDKCSYIERLIAINTLYINNKQDIADVIINRNINIISIYDSYIHCVLEKEDHNSFSLDQCSIQNCVHYKRFNTERNLKEKRTEDYNDVIYILDQIHCFLYHRNKSSSSRRRKCSEKFIRDLSGDDDEKEKGITKRKQYFGGELMDYWSPFTADYNESTDNIFIEDEKNEFGTVLFAKYDTLREEVTQNTVCCLNEDDYNDIYRKSMSLLATRYCQTNMKALCDDVWNEKTCIAPGDTMAVNHIISMIIYCNYFSVCSKWIESMNDECEFAHFYRYLAELCQLFGESMKDNEYLYITPSNDILFKEWIKMVHFPISVTQSIQSQHSNDNKNDKRNILKLGNCCLSGMRTRYFDVSFLSDSYDCDVRIIMMSPVRIYDILLDETRSCFSDINAIKLFQRIMSASYLENEMETQKILFSLIQNHIYSNMKQKALSKLASFKYIQDILDDLIRNEIETKIKHRSVIWINKSELNKLKCKELPFCIYNVKQNDLGTLLKHYNFNKKQIKFVQEYEFKIEETELNLLMQDNTNKMITSEDKEYIMDKESNALSLYFELSKKMIINNKLKNDEETANEFECYLWVNLITLTKNMDKALIECSVYCEDLHLNSKFEAVWASKDSDNVGGLLLDRNVTQHLNGLSSLTFIVALKVLQTNAVRSPTKSILSNFN